MGKGDKLPKLFQDPTIQNWMNTFDDFFKEPFSNFLPAQSFRFNVYMQYISDKLKYYKQLQAVSFVLNVNDVDESNR